jgi:hypothetical protein
MMDENRKGITRVTLTDALFFHAAASQAPQAEQVLITRYINAAILFGRHVTFQMQYEYSARAGFEPWYQVIQTGLNSDKLVRFMAEARTAKVHKAPLPINRMIFLAGTSFGGSSARAELTVKHNPLYRRGFRSRIEQALGQMKRILRLVATNQRPLMVAPPLTPPTERPQPKVPESYYFFDHADWRERSAIELVGEYLEKLAAVVNEVETKFPTQGV